jgi:putrescine transport system substrate-binding protein
LIGLAIAGALLLTACGKKEDAGSGGDGKASASKDLNVYNWSDYIAEDTLDNFKKESGIGVTYDVFDSNETLEAKLMAGSTGYDIVVPSLQFLGRQIQAGVFKPIDKTKLKNYGNLDPDLMAVIALNDPDNQYSIPYLWGTTGIGYNVDQVKKALGDAPVDSWKIALDPANLAKLKDCGVTMLDTPTELIPITLAYLGEDPNSFDPAVIAKAEEHLKKLKPYVRYFHSSQYIDGLANGDVCLSIGWSGDVFQARDRAAEANNSVTVNYIIPKEGAPMFFDMIAIPKDAKNIDNAYAFIDYLLKPEVMAPISSYVSYPSGNKASVPMVDEEVRNNPAVYPPEEVKKKLYTFKVLTPEVSRIYADAWAAMKAVK